MPNSSPEFAIEQVVGDDEHMEATVGKRELARRQTRRTIRQAAMGLFLEHGFDAVTTTEVAEAAGVSPATVFNYFETKEDLFFGQVRQLERDLAQVVHSCAPGDSILDALEAHVLYELTAGRDRTNPPAVKTFHHQVALSARLQAREHEMFDQRELVLAGALMQALGPDADPLHARVAAAMYVAAQKLIAAELRRHIARSSATKALRDIKPFIREVFAILDAGVGRLPCTRTASGS